MKKILAVLLAAVMVLALAACGEKKADDKVEPEAGVHQLADPFVPHKWAASRPDNESCGFAQGNNPFHYSTWHGTDTI